MGQGRIVARAGIVASAALIAAALTATAVLAGSAGAGSLDPSFSGDGKRLVRFGPYADNGYAMALGGDGRIVLAGSSVRSGANSDWAISRLLPGGDPDGSFSGDGKRFLSFNATTSVEAAWGVAVQGDNRIVLVGGAGSQGQIDFGVARLRPGGSFDPSFSDDGRRVVSFDNGAQPDQARAVAIQHDGRIVVAGESYQGGVSMIGVARFMPNGALDDSFSSDGKQVVRFDAASGGDSPWDLAIQYNGRIVVAGYSGTGSDQAIGIVRLLPGGQLDSSFSGDGRRLVRFQNGAYSDLGFAVALTPQRRIVVAGRTSGAGGSSFGVVRLNPGGDLDQSFSGNGRRAVSFGAGSLGSDARGVAVRGDGRIIAVGSSSPGMMQSDFAIARLLPDGDLDGSFSGDGKRLVTFGPGGVDLAQAVALQANGRVVVAGTSSAPGDSDFAVARLLGG